MVQFFCIVVLIIPNSLAVWGAISGGSFNNVLKKLDGRLDSRQYIECLNKNIVPYTQNKPLVHDYFPFHNAVSVQQFLKSHGVTVLQDWQKKLGDIMPLETVWLYIIDRLTESNILASNDSFNYGLNCLNCGKLFLLTVIFVQLFLQCLIVYTK